MRAQKFNVTIAEDHRLRLDLPSDFPSGPAEVIVLAERVGSGNIVRLGGVLQSKGDLSGDPIAEALSELRMDREDRILGRVDSIGEES